MSDILEFRHDLIHVDGAENDLELRERAFVERICSLLGAGEVAEDLVPSQWRGKGTAGRLIGVDAATLQNPDGSVTLLLAIFNGDAELAVFPQAELAKHALRLRNFAEEALAGGLLGKMPKNSPEEDLREALAERAQSLTKARLLLVTDLKLGERVRELQAEVVAGIPCEFHVWDIARLHELVSKGHEALEIDLREDFNISVPCLAAHLGTDEYQSFLCVMPAALLADLYERYGARLLETNVRGFLSERGKVNRGIRSTIQNRPEMFFAYNNGLTATAFSVEMSEDESRILRINDLQIVNGGQTTASLFWARKKHRVKLDNVSVQMKLSVIPDSMASRFDEIVGDISKFANSQNKVSDADLFANHAFHREMEKISRRTGIAPIGGGQYQAYWFYERARAQYDNERAILSKADTAKFDKKFPRTQLVSKTDLAKYWACWEQLPYVVSLGAQKNFKRFADTITTRWDKNPDQFNEVFFKRLIGVAILYKAMEKRIQKETWYEGYRINIIAYALAVLFHSAESLGKRINLLGVWAAQGIDEATETALVNLAEQVYVALRDSDMRATRPQWGNLGQWFKESKCWEEAREISVDLPICITSSLISLAQHQAQDIAGSRGKQVDDGLDAQMEVVRLHGQGFWQRLRDWNQEDPVLSQLEFDAVTRIAQRPSTFVPLEKESVLLMNAIKHAESEGFLGRSLAASG